MAILYRADEDDIPYSMNYEGQFHAVDGCAVAGPHLDTLPRVTFAEAQTRVYQIPRKQKDNRYTNFFRNFKYFYDMAGELSPTELKNFAKAITDKCEVIEVRSWQVDQAISMFNSLNSDGMPLCDADIIAAMLYANANRPEERDAFNELWKELLDLADEIDGIDSILQQHMYYERATRKEIISDTGTGNVTTPGVRKYYTDIRPVLLEQPVDLCEKMVGPANGLEYPIIHLCKFCSSSTRT